MDEQNEKHEKTFGEDREEFLDLLGSNRITWKHILVGSITVLVFVVLIFFEVRAMTQKGGELLRGGADNAQESFTADDEVIQKYLPFADHYLTGEAKQLLGMSYSDVCELFGHTASDADFSDGCDGFYFIVKYDCDVTVDLHFKNNELYRVAVYSAAEDYDKALSAAEEKYGDMFSYDEETNKCCFVHDDSCDYWVWLPEDGRTHQQFISRYKDDIGYYVDEGFFGKDCPELMGQSYMQVCKRFEYEMSEDDFDSDGGAYFGYTIFRYEDPDRDEYVRFNFFDSKLGELKLVIPAEKADLWDSIAAKAEEAYGEPLMSTEDDDYRVYSVTPELSYIMELDYDGRVIQRYTQYKFD